MAATVQAPWAGMGPDASSLHPDSCVLSLRLMSCSFSSGCPGLPWPADEAPRWDVGDPHLCHVHTVSPSAAGGAPDAGMRSPGRHVARGSPGGPAPEGCGAGPRVARQRAHAAGQPHHRGRAAPAARPSPLAASGAGAPFVAPPRSFAPHSQLHCRGSPPGPLPPLAHRHSRRWERSGRHRHHHAGASPNEQGKSSGTPLCAG